MRAVDTSVLIRLLTRDDGLHDGPVAHYCRASMKTMLAMVLSLAACARGGAASGTSTGGDDAAGDDTPPDAGHRDGAPSAGEDTASSGGKDAAASAVLVTRSVTWLGGSSERTQPDDLTMTEIGVWTADGTYIAGHGEANGQGRVDGVPAGPVMLRFGTTYVAAADARSFDMSEVMLGGGTSSEVMTPTALNLTLTGLAPWGMADRLILYVPAAGAFETNLTSRLTPAIAAGAAAMTGQGDYQKFQSAYGFDGSAGDEAWFTHQAAQVSTEGVPYIAVQKALSTRGLKVVSGQPATFTGALADVTSTKTAMLDWSIPALGALASAVSPTASVPHGYFHVVALPGGERYGAYTTAAPLLYVPLDPGSPSFRVKATYGDPYPASWGRLALARMWYVVPLSPLPGANGPLGVSTSITVEDAATALVGHAVGPLITPPQSPTVNGRPAFGDTSGATLTPELAWSPPAMGKPDVYHLRLGRGEVMAGGSPAIPTVASFYTDATKIRIPPGLLKQGERYFVIIDAVMREGLPATRPWFSPARTAKAPCVTGWFTP
jgi:hypothetical protein